MKLLTELYEHQAKAVEKIKKIKVGALYLEMGTGKTRTALELIKIRLDKKRIEHVIWLCPCSVKINLKKDIEKHTGEFDENLFTICGIETLSSSIKENMRLINIAENKECLIIVDESNMIKNHRTKRSERIISLGKLAKYRLILNGTPITRSEEDLFTQWYFLDYRILGYQSFWSFAANHLEYDEKVKGKVRRTLNVDYLTEKIALYSYQVKKSECLTLPEKIYEEKYYEIPDIQHEHYRYVADQLLFSVDELKPHTIYRFLTAMQSVIAGYELTIDKETLEFTKERMFKNPIDNPRLQYLLKIIDEIDPEEKIIIFCKYTDEILDVSDALNEKYGEEAAVKFYGGMNIKKRECSIEYFSKNSRFLIANKQCGAYGLNLQYCSYVIYYSNDWDYGTRIQSEDRVHRIGQKKNVCIIDIMADLTIDERIYKCLKKKENLVDSFKTELESIKDKQDLYNWISVETNNRKKKIVDKSDLKEGEYFMKTAYFTKNIDEKFNYIREYISNTDHDNIVYFCPKKYGHIAEERFKGEGVYVFFYEDINKTNAPYNTTNENTLLILDGSARYKNITSYVFKRIEKLALVAKNKLMVDIVPFTTDIMYSYIPFSHLKRQILGHQHWYAFRENNMEYNKAGELVEGHDFNLLAEKMVPVTKIDYEHFMECNHETIKCELSATEQEEYENYRNELFEQYSSIQPILTRLADFVNTRDSRYKNLYNLVKGLKGNTIVYTNIKSHNPKIKKLLKEFENVEVRTFYDNNEKEQFADNIILAEIPIVKNYLFLDVIANAKKDAKFYFITGYSTIDDLLYKRMFDEFTQIDEFTNILSRKVNGK